MDTKPTDKGGKGKRDNQRFHRKEHEGGEHKRNDHRKGGKPENAPKDSYFYKFHYGPWPEFDKIEVKIDTELPPKIPKEEKLREPTKEEYVKHLQHLDDEIKRMVEKIKQLNEEKKIKRGIMVKKSGEDGEGAHDESKGFKALVAERNKHKDERNKMEDESKAIKKALDNYEKELALLLKNCDPNALSIHNVKKKIHHLEGKMETSSMSATNQAKVIKQIDMLEKSKKYVEKVQKIMPEKEKLSEKVKVLEKQAKDHRKEIIRINKILDELNADFKKRKEVSQENKTELDELEEKIQSIKTEINEIDIRKNEFREEHYKRKYEFECQKQRMLYLEGLHRRQNDLKREQAEQARVEEEKRAERDSMPNPNQDEIETVDFLIRLLNKHHRDHELKHTAQQKDEERKNESAKLAEDIQKKAEEGKIMFIKPKHLREKESTIVIGGKQKKGRKGGKRQQNKPEQTENTESDKLTFKFEIMQNFAMFKVKVPETHSEIPEVVLALEKLKEELFSNGEKLLDEQYKNTVGETTGEQSEVQQLKSKEKLKYDADEDVQSWPTLG